MDRLTRRTFLSAVGTATGATATAKNSTKQKKKKPSRAIPFEKSLQESVEHLVNETPFVDTHEHFWEESERIRAVSGKDRSIPATDFGMLLCHYSDSDLQVAGMPPDAHKKLLHRDIPLPTKWELLRPWYERCRHTGYQQCIRETVRRLFDVPDIQEDTYQRISELIAEHTRPGLYKRLLRDIANIEYAQVNCIQSKVFRRTEQPELLAVDLSINNLCVPPDLDVLAEFIGGRPETLEHAHQAIDICFAKYAPAAIAVKSQCAYWRSLDFPMVSTQQAAPLFAKYARKEPLLEQEDAAIQGHLFHYCVDKATHYALPIKLHTGYFAGHNVMPLHRVRSNGGDLCSLVTQHPQATFVLFHCAYPYQDEAIALAKHYTNVYVDMCWTWIINPLASIRFLKEFLMAAPACKLFTFGGDYLCAELSVGHAAIARKGIIKAIVELVHDKWLEEHEVPDLVRRIMNGNAHEIYDHDRVIHNS